MYPRFSSNMHMTIRMNLKKTAGNKVCENEIEIK